MWTVGINSVWPGSHGVGSRCAKSGNGRDLAKASQQLRPTLQRCRKVSTIQSVRTSCQHMNREPEELMGRYRRNYACDTTRHNVFDMEGVDRAAVNVGEGTTRLRKGEDAKVQLKSSQGKKERDCLKPACVRFLYCGRDLLPSMECL